MKENPFPKSNFFVTPDSPEDLLIYCENFTGGERGVAITVAAMAMNLAYEMFEQATKGEAK